MAEPVREDRRVRRTRRALQDALLSLMAEKSYEAISVQDIIDRADVGRSTFYNHFVDKDELLRDGISALRTILLGDTTDEEGKGGFAFSLPMLRHFAENRPLVVAMLGRQGGTSMLPHIAGVVTGAVRDELGRRERGSAKVPDEALAAFLSGGFLAIAEWWTLEEPEREAEEVDATFQALAATVLG